MYVQYMLVVYKKLFQKYASWSSFIDLIIRGIVVQT